MNKTAGVVALMGVGLLATVALAGHTEPAKAKKFTFPYLNDGETQQTARAYGVLANAHSISSKETMNLLSLMRLGVDLGLFPDLERWLVDELFILTQPAHLQKLMSSTLDGEERNAARARYLRSRLREGGPQPN